MKVVITGGGGQIGRELAEYCVAAGDEVLVCDHEQLDVTDRDALMQCVLSVRPDAVAHTAAWTAVDACESDVPRAFAVNALGTRHVAEACHRAGAYLLYLSTDYVFDGTVDRPYHEWDTPNPQSVYGRSKYAGELEVRALAGSRVAVVRTSWVCGRYGNNLVKTVLRLAQEQQLLSFVADQRGNPTIVSDLVPVLRRFGVERRPGLFHVSNQGAVSRHEFAQAVMVCAGHDPDRVRPISTTELDPPRPAPRPANSVLDNAAMRLSGLSLLPDFRQSLPSLIERVRQPYAG